MAFVFRSRDRRLMTQAHRDLVAIKARDVRAANPKKTTILSTRSLILDTNNTAGGYLYACNQLIGRLFDQLAETR